MYAETPVVPTNTTMHHPIIRSGPLPRRHTVSLPYPSIDSLPPPPTKSRKPSLKAKRHKSMGKLNVYSDPPPVPDLSAKLEQWTHEQLLERVKELEKEKEVAAQQKQIKGTHRNIHKYILS